MKHRVMALAMSLGVAAGLKAQEPVPARIHGLVIEQGVGKPVADATVTLSPGELSAITAANGRFVLRDIPPGRYIMQVQRLGYVTRVDTAYIATGKPVNVTIALATRAVELEPIEVEVRSRDLEIAGVYDRMESLRSTHFFSAGTIERANVPLMTDLFHRVPSTIVQYKGPGRTVIRFNRPSGFASGDCEPALYVDGLVVRDNLTDDGGRVLDFNRVPPEQIAAIEIYVGVHTPLQFRQNNCGSILVWTKRGG